MIVPLFFAVDFFNFTYRTNPCAKNVPVPAVMRKGTFSYFDKRMDVGFDLAVRAVQRGSLRAGTRQAVVVIACDFPIGGTAAAYAFDERPNAAVPLGQVATANWGGDWGRGPDAMRFRFANGKLIAEQCDGDDCDRLRTTTYALRGSKLVAVKVTRTAVPANAARTSSRRHAKRAPALGGPLARGSAGSQHDR